MNSKYIHSISRFSEGSTVLTETIVLFQLNMMILKYQSLWYDLKTDSYNFLTKHSSNTLPSLVQYFYESVFMRLCYSLVWVMTFF